MPTPVAIARQCLTQEASSALDEAVGVARRRSHSQTTSLHLISAFLSLPTSSLRDACSRVRSSAYAPRFQFKALELCFGSALDRLPSTQSSNNESEPPISNSLMAAIKRSQAHQRRNPESFHLYQQQQQQSSSLNCVKVEVQQLVLSILDDPIVSRVFGEAGFRSCDIKLAILRPLPSLSRLQRSRRAPLFLCNLTEGGDSDFAARNFNFPFLGCSGFTESNEGDENFRRIGEVLARKKERNPLLVGVYATEALRSFSEIVQRGRAGSVPAELSGLSLFTIEKEIHKFISEGGSEGLFLNSKFEELHKLIANCCGPGVVVSFGDLSVLLDDNSLDSVGYVVSQLSRLSELHGEKLWLMGAVASYETYLKFLMRFPSIEKEWDLQILPITSVKTSPLGGFQSRPQSLMESFVPFGGFFSTTSDMSSPFTSTFQPISRCHLCNEKCEQEVSAFSNGGCTPSVADQYNASLPSWLQKNELNTNKGFDITQAKHDGTVFNAKVTGLQKKWNDICRRLHHCPAIAKDDYRVIPQVVSGTMGFPFLSDRKDDANSLSGSSDIRAIPNENDCINAQPSASIESHKTPSPTQRTPEPFVSEAKHENFTCEPMKESRAESLRVESPRLPPFPFPSGNSSFENPSPSITTPVTTDLGLGTLYASVCKEPVMLTQTDKGWLKKFSISPEKVDVARPNIPNPSIQSPSCSGAEQVDPNDVKSLWRCLMDKVGRQNEAIRTISQIISLCRTGNERRRGASVKRDVWLSFIGLDRVAKRRTVLALAEVVFGRKQNVISVDLSSQDGHTHSKTIFGCKEMNGDDAKFRGKMVVDYIAEEISKKPLSIVFLENINKADMLLQNSLSLAIKTGKLSDSRGREVSVNNTIFVATSSTAVDNTVPSVENTCNRYSEERILKAQNLEMQILIVHAHEDNIKTKFSNVLVTSKKETGIPSFMNKRKLVEGSDITEKGDTHDWLGRAKKTPKFLDLNLPVNDTETINFEYDSSESDTISENSEMWLEEFLAQMDGSVVFKPFDFDALASTLLKKISAVVRDTIGPDCLLEMDSKVMEQILAASWLSDRERAAEDWVEQILGRSFVEARQSYACTGQSVFKLVTCDDQYVKDQAPGVCLPSRIIVKL